MFKKFIKYKKFYSNSKFIKKIINSENINAQKVFAFDIEKDNNCLMQCISLFLYHDKNKHNVIRSKIINYLKLRIWGRRWIYSQFRWIYWIYC